MREYNEEKKIPGNILVDLNINNQTFLAARGGVGGRGNKHFVTKYLKAPKKSEEGKLGERKVLLLELKSIANVGLVVNEFFNFISNFLFFNKAFRVFQMLENLLF